jgi:manganese efflux pump family protein
MARAAPAGEGIVLRLPSGGILSMTPAALLVIALGMSVDAFAAALAKGAVLHRPHLREALRTGAIFGSVEAITPVLGWIAGLAAAQFIQAVDHWIALILLAGVGGKMIYESFRPRAAERPSQHSLRLLVITAIATSIDALAVGVMLAVLGVDIVAAAIAIGLATFVMTSTGMLIARHVGPRLGPWAERIGGSALVLLGVSIFLQHTLAP